MKDDSGFRISHDLTVLEFKEAQGYLIRCDDWDYIKAQMKQLSDKSGFVSAIGWVFMGAAVSVLINIFTHTYSDPIPLVIAWACFCVTVSVGPVLLYLSHRLQKLRGARISDLMSMMERIEAQFERGSETADIFRQQALFRELYEFALEHTVLKTGDVPDDPTRSQ